MSESLGMVPQSALAIAVAAPVGGIYDYLAGPAVGAVRGNIVMVPFGGRHLPGIVMGTAIGDVPVAKLRAVETLVTLPPLSDALVQFIERVAAWTMAPLGAVVKMVLSQPAAFDRPPQQKRYSIGAPAGAARLTTARQHVLDYLAKNEAPDHQADAFGVTAAMITAACGASQAVINGMETAGLLQVKFVSADQPPALPRHDLDHVTLTSDQQQAAVHLCGAVGQGFQTCLLDGVTGSGKTEVYFEAVEAAVAAGQQVLILLPEIALSAAWRARFTARFGVPPVEWHSDISAAQKRKSWRFILQGRASVVVGARSALFLPFSHLGLIIVDEEHEHAFKQEDQVIYQARDMAVLRGRLDNVPVVLASATPSLESWVNAGKTGETPRYQHVGLPNRIHGAALPVMTAIDLRQTPPERGRWLSPPLVDAIAARLEAGEQSLLFLNRRGYAPLTLCGSCGHKLTCPNCDSWMVAHKLSGRLRCHHCGHQTRPSNHCTACGQTDTMQACGPGVERLAEEVLWRFPDARFAVLSSDTVGTPKAAEAFIQSVIDGDVDIIIGTQMVAKGHHFPNLTLVGVVDADLGLAGGDLRAAERTFQMLSQVAGRAGRESRPGEAMLQTLDPENQVLACLLEGKRDAFLSMEAHARSLAGMPPSGQLAALILSSHDEKRLHATLRRLDKSKPHFTGVDIFGPAIAPIGFLKGRYRGRLLIRTDRSVDIQGILRDWLADFKSDSGVKLQ
ncbi:MAG: primosomal protein N', partial [Alphaproteobacteria bacterium]|nr:primosomal protein N' [Alphaproteobacteria bacterium]